MSLIAVSVRRRFTHRRHMLFCAVWGKTCAAFLFSPGPPAFGGASPRRGLWWGKRIQTEKRRSAVLAGNIRIGKDIIIGTGDIILAVTFLLCAVFWVCLVVAELRGLRLERAQIRAAQGVEIARGVTLFQGMQAYYGEEGTWYLYCRTVLARLSGPGPSFRVGTLRDDGGIDHLELSVMDNRFERLGEEEQEALLRAMAQAVEKRRSASGAKKGPGGKRPEPGKLP